MKKEKLYLNFLSAADKVFSTIAVLFLIQPATVLPHRARVPFAPRR